MTREQTTAVTSSMVPIREHATTIRIDLRFGAICKHTDPDLRVAHLSISKALHGSEAWIKYKCKIQALNTSVHLFLSLLNSINIAYVDMRIVKENRDEPEQEHYCKEN